MNILDSKTHHYIYWIENLINGKYYIGIHSTNNLFDGYIGSGKIILQAYDKYGTENFDMTIIQKFNTRLELSLAEKVLITEDVVNDPKCYNIRLGGIDGIQSKITKKRMSIAQKGIKPSKKSREKMSNSQKKRSKETCEGTRRASEKMTGRKVGNLNKWKGQTKYDNESIAKMADKLRGRTKETHEGIRKQSEAMKGRTKEDYKYLMDHSERLLGKTKQDSLRILKASITKSKGFYITPYGTFYSSLDAAKHLGCTAQRVITACKTNNNKVFSSNSFSQSGGVFTLFKHSIGKTYKEIGFYFAKFTNNSQKQLLLNKLI